MHGVQVRWRVNVYVRDPGVREEVFYNPEPVRVASKQVRITFQLRRGDGLFPGEQLFEQEFPCHAPEIFPCPGRVCKSKVSGPVPDHSFPDLFEQPEFLRAQVVLGGPDHVKFLGPVRVAVDGNLKHPFIYFIPATYVVALKKFSVPGSFGVDPGAGKRRPYMGLDPAFVVKENVGRASVRVCASICGYGFAASSFSLFTTSPLPENGCQDLFRGML